MGQERAVNLLRRGLERGAVAHAYLFVGPAHIGKMTLAVNLAQALNCEGEARPCGNCIACQRIAAGKHADVQTIELQIGVEGGDFASKTRISVEQIDQVLHSVNLPPFEGRCKVFIIDDIEHLSTGAANRLLKTLEEPVGRVVFILLTANENRVLPTIASRCQRVELKRFPAAEIVSALTTRWKVAPGKADLLARLSVGCPGWAVTMAGNESLFQQRTGWLDDWLEAMEADNDRRFAFAANLVERYAQNRETVQQKLALLLEWWRDLLLVKLGEHAAITNIDREDALQAGAGHYNLGRIREFISKIQSAQQQLRLNANPQLVLEVLMLNIPEREKAASPPA